MNAYDDMPITTVLLNRETKTVFVKTHHGPLEWLMAPRGRTARRVSSAAMAVMTGLVELKEATP